ncbi:MAG: hypothetical protein V4479_08395, partial [Actinomycetota bacterium]
MDAEASACRPVLGPGRGIVRRVRPGLVGCGAGDGDCSCGGGEMIGYLIFLVDELKTVGLAQWF